MTRPIAILGIAFALTSLAMPASAVTPPPALSSVESASVRADVQAALSGINPSLTGVARIQAIDAALQLVVQSTVAPMGPGAIAVVVADAIAAGVSPTTAVDAGIRGGVAAGVSGSTAVAQAIIGGVNAGAAAANVAAQALATAALIPIPPEIAGLGAGEAAGELSSTNLAAAQAIGQTVANEGTQPMRVAYAQGVTSSGGTEELAALSDAYPVATGETGQTGKGANNNFGYNQNQGTTTVGDAATNNNQQANQNQNLPACSGPTCI